jgi:hypothetical protein
MLIINYIRYRHLCLNYQLVVLPPPHYPPHLRHCYLAPLPRALSFCVHHVILYLYSPSVSTTTQSYPSISNISPTLHFLFGSSRPDRNSPAVCPRKYSVDILFCIVSHIQVATSPTTIWLSQLSSHCIVVGSFHGSTSGTMYSLFSMSTFGGITHFLFNSSTFLFHATHFPFPYLLVLLCTQPGITCYNIRLPTVSLFPLLSTYSDLSSASLHVPILLVYHIPLPQYFTLPNINITPSPQEGQKKTFGPISGKGIRGIISFLVLAKLTI